jgi:hypothetical protein
MENEVIKTGLHLTALRLHTVVPNTFHTAVVQTVINQYSFKSCKRSATEYIKYAMYRSGESYGTAATEYRSDRVGAVGAPDLCRAATCIDGGWLYYCAYLGIRQRFESFASRNREESVRKYPPK